MLAPRQTTLASKVWLDGSSSVPAKVRLLNFQAASECSSGGVARTKRGFRRLNRFTWYVANDARLDELCGRSTRRGDRSASYPGAAADSARRRDSWYNIQSKVAQAGRSAELGRSALSPSAGFRIAAVQTSPLPARRTLRAMGVSDK